MNLFIFIILDLIFSISLVKILNLIEDKYGKKEEPKEQYPSTMLEAIERERERRAREEQENK